MFSSEYFSVLEARLPGNVLKLEHTHVYTLAFFSLVPRAVRPDESKEIPRKFLPGTAGGTKVLKISSEPGPIVP